MKKSKSMIKNLRIATVFLLALGINELANAATNTCEIGQWTGIVGTLSGDEPPEATDDIISGGVIRIPPSLSSDDYYWTRFRLAIPSNFSGDNARLEVKLKDPDSEGGIGAYDTWLNIIGNGDGVTDKAAGVTLMGDSWGQSWDAMYAADSVIRDMPELVVPLDDWHTIAVESKNGVFSVYYDSVKIKDMPYSGQVGTIKYIDVGFKGSGSIDDVKLYEKGVLILQDAFDSASSARLFCNPKLATPRGLKIPSLSPFTLKWNAVPNATSYRFVISQDKYFKGFTEKLNKSTCDSSCVTFKIPINSSAKTYTYTPTLAELNFTFPQIGTNYISIRAGSKNAEFSNWGIWSFIPDVSLTNTPTNNTGILNPYPIDGDRQPLTKDEAFYVLDAVNFPRFSYAIKNKRFDVNKLNPNDRSLFASMIMAKGISMNSNLFEGAASEAFKKKDAEYKAKWDSALDDAINKMAVASQLNLSDYLELTLKTGTNMAGGIADAITIGLSAGVSTSVNTVKVVKNLKNLEKLKKAVRTYKRYKGSSHYKTVTKFLAVLDSNEFKLFSLLVDNGFEVKAEAMELISSDESLQAQLKNISVSLTDFEVGKVLESKKIGGFTGFMANKISQATVSLVIDFLSGDIETDAGAKELIKDIFKSVREFIPIVGPMFKEYDITQEILERKEPGELAASQEYMRLNEQYRKETDALSAERTLAKLQMTLKAAEQRFSNINDVHF